MVRISQDLLLKYASHTKQHSNENDLHYLKRLTHIYLQERSIEEIDNLSSCKNLSVLYLYDNLISKIKNLGFAINLTHLYLQKNKITHITGLQRLANLSKLYLGHNSITVVEGLDHNEFLTELHIEYQDLPPGEKLLFDPHTMECLSKSLSILNIAGNNIDDIGDLKILRRLNHLILSHNDLSNWSSLADVLLGWSSLFKLDIAGNPICKHKKYRDKLIIMSKSLVMIDDKEVSESNRQFLQNWYTKKEEQKQKKYIKEQAESYDFTPSARDPDRLHIQYPYPYDSIYKLQNSASYQPTSNKHVTKNQQQFNQILARANTLPPLDSREQRPR